jgi:hypothetical protein
MGVFEAVPEVCPSAEYVSGTKAEFTAAWDVDGLPEASVVLRDEWTYPNGVTAPGYIVAVREDELIGFLYVRGHRATVDERVAELARMLAEKLVVARDSIEEAY